MIGTFLGVAALAFFWMDGKFDRITDKFEEVNNRLGKHDTADELLAQRTAGLEKGVSTVEAGLKEANGKLDVLIGRQQTLN